jgi:thiamine pyrophosphokinase
VPAVIVFAAAPLTVTERLRSRLSHLERPVVIAADDGATTALAFGLTPDVVIGDLDSLEPATRARLANVPVEEYPRDKDFTDGQLAIERALKFQPSELLLLGFLGGPRLDQAVANVLLLLTLSAPAVLLDEANECALVRPDAPLGWTPESDEVVSLIPLSGDARGVKTHGLRWALSGETLRLGDTRGLSNEPVGDQARVTIEAGLLLVTRHFAT